MSIHGCLSSLLYKDGQPKAPGCLVGVPKLWTEFCMPKLFVSVFQWSSESRSRERERGGKKHRGEE